jgi:hypothetical protein
VLTAAESEPKAGSVIAIAAHMPEKRSSCSSVATEPIAALPRPWRGIDSSRPTSPQHISIVPSTTFRLAPLRLPFSLSGPDRRTPAAPAPPSPEELRPSSSAANMSSSAGYVCSARSYLREIGRNTSAAAWYAWLISAPAFLGTSRLIMVQSLSEA